MGRFVPIGRVKSEPVSLNDNRWHAAILKPGANLPWRDGLPLFPQDADEPAQAEKVSVVVKRVAQQLEPTLDFLLGAFLRPQQIIPDDVAQRATVLADGILCVVNDIGMELDLGSPGLPAERVEPPPPQPSP